MIYYNILYLLQQYLRWTKSVADEVVKVKLEKISRGRADASPANRSERAPWATAARPGYDRLRVALLLGVQGCGV